MTDFLLMVGGALFAMFISGIVNYKKSAWVGLTDAEMKQTCYEVCSYDPYTIARAIEARLKEKNT
jgi:hypothetical protein